ncbi:hypothetical protein V6N13_005587 [Hibiscus sabdariffa]|uniref:Arabinogalactan-protein n=1 Tax=Hibiscus sabdariffa TaxID=183260 RepID=A0ABR2ESV8_9ROSI
MALYRFLSLIVTALLFCSVIAQSPTPSPKKSPPSTVSTPSPSETPIATPPSPVAVESPDSPPSSSPLSPVTGPSSISEPPAEAPAPAENSAVLSFNRFGATGSVAVAMLAAAMAM